MGKWAHFDRFSGEGWPDPEWLKQFFLAPQGQRWSFAARNDNWSLSIYGAEGTDNFPPIDRRRIDIHLVMWGNQELGVMLMHRRQGGGLQEWYDSVGDLRRVREHVRSLQGDLLPIGLFIPFEKAWLAVEEFMRTEGKLPKSIEWIDESKLPPDAFPGPT